MLATQQRLARPRYSNQRRGATAVTMQAVPRCASTMLRATVADGSRRGGHDSQWRRRCSAMEIASELREFASLPDLGTPRVEDTVQGQR